MSTVLEAELLVHLDTQINSARHLLKLVLAQGAAIRERDTEAVLARLAEIQTEMVRRGGLEQERATLLQRAGSALGVPATTVTLERLCTLVTPGAAKAAMERSAELRGLLRRDLQAVHRRVSKFGHFRVDLNHSLIDLREPALGAQALAVRMGRINGLRTLFPRAQNQLQPGFVPVGVGAVGFGHQ